MSVENIKPSVLVIEDDRAIVTLLEYTLDKAGYRVQSTEDGEEALLMMEESKPDLVIIDWMLPGLTGIQICNRIRNNKEMAKIPIIMVSARGEESDKVEGLDGGVDDYLVKPFSPKELLARINSVFRRIRPAFAEKKLTFGRIEMDLVSKTVINKGEELHLGPIEYKLLQSFLEYPGRVLSRDQLIRRVWGHSLHVEPRTVDVHINRLRKSLKLDKKAGTIIRTVRASGYCLKDADESGFDLIPGS